MACCTRAIHRLTTQLPNCNKTFTYSNLNHPFLTFPPNPSRRLLPRCSATSPGPPPPTPPPESNKDPITLTGVEAKFSKVRDSMQIFFAVLFWMSLFFWACVWDDKNNVRPNKGSRFKR